VIRLKPDEAYQRALAAHVELTGGDALPQSVTFRLQFKDLSKGPKPAVPLVWSNAVTVNVTR
jgi:hypothetical protein